MAKWNIEVYADLEVEGATEEAAIAAAFEQLANSGDLSGVLMASAEWIPACKFCGCTESAACEGGCEWADSDATYCTSPACLEKAAAEGLR